MGVRLTVAALLNSVFINMQEYIAVGASGISIGILFTNRELPTIHSESVPRSRSKAGT